MQNLLTERALTALTLFLIAATLLVSTSGLEFSDLGGAYSPTFFPSIVLMLWMGLALVALIAELRAAEASKSVRLAHILALTVAVLVYVNSIMLAGFFIASAVFAIIALVIFGVRNPLILLAYAVAVPGALVALFNHALKMPLPTSPFTYWF